MSPHCRACRRGRGSEERGLKGRDSGPAARPPCGWPLPAGAQGTFGVLWAGACEGAATCQRLLSSLAETPCPVPACSKRPSLGPLSPASYHLEAL